MKLVILDRDGTINQDVEDFLRSPDEWVPLPGALAAIARLNHAGYAVVIAANLPSLGRGLYDMGMLNAIHARMNKALAAIGGRIDATFFCPHAPDESCDCRKPLPGLFRQIGQRFGVQLADVPVVGDSHRDMQGAAAAGCLPHLVLTGEYAGRAMNPLPPELPPNTRVHADLAAFVGHWLAEQTVLEAAANARAAVAAVAGALR